MNSVDEGQVAAIREFQQSRQSLVESARKRFDLTEAHVEIRMHGYIDYLLSLLATKTCGCTDVDTCWEHQGDGKEIFSPPVQDKQSPEQAYLQGGCTENECRLCHLAPYARKEGMKHAGLSAYDPPSEVQDKSLRFLVRDDAESFIRQHMGEAHYEGERLIVSFEREALIEALVEGVQDKSVQEEELR